MKYYEKLHEQQLNKINGGMGMAPIFIGKKVVTKILKKFF